MEMVLVAIHRSCMDHASGFKADRARDQLGRSAAWSVDLPVVSNISVPTPAFSVRGRHTEALRNKLPCCLVFIRGTRPWIAGRAIRLAPRSPRTHPPTRGSRTQPVKILQARKVDRAIDSRANLSRASFAQPAHALDREWLVTNGLGGFACASVALANTRRYHGVLVASLKPPAQRVLMVAKVEPTVRYRGVDFRLGCSEFADGTLVPRGFELLSAFQLEDGLPTWTYAFADALLEQRIWMADGRNTTYISFTLNAASAPVDLELLPLCTYRDYHSQTRGGWGLAVDTEEHGCRVTAFAGAQPAPSRRASV